MIRFLTTALLILSCCSGRAVSPGPAEPGEAPGVRSQCPPPPEGGGRARGEVTDESRAIARYIKGQMPAVLSCYRARSETAPALQGKLVMRMTVAPDGRVTEVKIEHDTLHDEPTTACALEELRRWHFDRVDLLEATAVTVPLVFTPGALGE